MLDYWICHDSGRLINPLIVEGQIEGAVALGIGSALLEDVRYDDARAAARRQLHGLRAAAQHRRARRSRIEHLETLSPLNPLGLKGVGESGALPVAAVLASAIEDALATDGVVIRADAAHALPPARPPRPLTALPDRARRIPPDCPVPMNSWYVTSAPVTLGRRWEPPNDSRATR